DEKALPFSGGLIAKPVRRVVDRTVAQFAGALDLVKGRFSPPRDREQQQRRDRDDHRECKTPPVRRHFALLSVAGFHSCLGMVRRRPNAARSLPAGLGGVWNGGGND